MIRESIPKVVSGAHLTAHEARAVMIDMLSGAATDAQTGAFLTALAMKGETEEELFAFASVMKEFCRVINPDVKGRLVDTCGTGGDGLKTFNVSTVAALVAAGAGVIVAKHGNRSVTSKSGSADVLERLGMNLSQEPDEVKRAIETIGIGFMFAPRFHPTMRAVRSTRQEIGIRTVFNLLGPLVNPANAQAHLLGVAEQAWVTPLATTLMNLGCGEALVVHGIGGFDEISLFGKTVVAQVKGADLTYYELLPRDFALEPIEAERLLVTDPQQSARLTLTLLNANPRARGPMMSVTLANAAAAIFVAGLGDDLKYCVELAAESIASGAAYEKLRALVELSGGNFLTLDELEGSHA
ncbi:MAG: anthranilate phosphoribosyltransferase [Halobacteriota archaeon]